MNNKWKKGDTVWKIGDAYLPLEEILIVEEPILTDEGKFYKYKSISHYGTSYANENDLFKTRKEAIMELELRDNTEVEKVAENINSIEDLVKMMYVRMDTLDDCIQKEVAKSKAKEYLGIEL